MKTYAKAVAITNVTKSGTQTIDGVALAANDRVLLTGQTAVSPAGSDNGLWDVNSGAWTRSVDADTDSELRGISVFVTQGTRRGDTAWQCINDVPITVGTSAIQFRQLPGVADKTCLDQLCGGLNGAAVLLTDGNQTLTIATGRHYLQGPSAPLTKWCNKTLSATGAASGDLISIDRADQTCFSMQIMNGGPAGGSLGVSSGPYDVSYYRFDGTNWKADGILPDTTNWPVFNVRDFGARGDEQLTGLDTAAEAAAIQAAIDNAATCARANCHGGAVVEFPPGIYVITGHPLILRRTSNAYHKPIIYRGAGWHATTIQNATGDVFRVETLTENANTSEGGEGHVFQDIAFSGKGYNLIWDLGEDVLQGDGVRPSLHFLRCFFDRGWCGPAVRLVRPSRARFVECVVSPFNYYAGGTGFEIIAGSASFNGCRGGQALIRARDAGEIYMVNCRAEGGQGTPSWDFLHCSSVMISHSANEGHRDRDAIYRFDQCNSVVLDLPVVANSDFGYVHMTGLVSMTGNPTVTFTHTDATIYKIASNIIERSSGSWFDDQIGYSSKIQVTNASSNTAWYNVIEATHTKLWVAETVVTETVASAAGNGTMYKTNLSLQPTISFSSVTKKLTRSTGSWIVDGFQVGMAVITSSVSNPGPFTITAVSVLELTLAETPNTESGLTGRTVQGNKFAAGIVFRSTWNFEVRRALTAGMFRGAGDQTRYGIEVDASCRNGSVSMSGPGINFQPGDILIDPNAKNVTGEYAYDTAYAPYQGTEFLGRHQLEALSIEEDVLHLRAGQAAVPTFAGLSVAAGGGNGFTGLWFSGGAWHLASTTSESYLSSSSAASYHDLFARRLVGPTGDNAYVVSQVGAGVVFMHSSSTLGDKQGVAFARNADFYCTITSPINLYVTTASGYIQIESAAAASVSGATTANLLGGGLQGVSVSSVGLGLLGGVVSSGSKVLSVAVCTTPPIANPVNDDVYIYGEAGALKARTKNGLVQELACKARPSAAGISLGSDAVKLLTTDASNVGQSIYTIPANSVAELDVCITAYRTGGSAGGSVGDVASFRRRVLAKNVSGTASKVQEDTLGTDVNQAGVGGVTLAASGADIQATVTGAANKNLTWAFKVDARPLLTP